MSTLEELMRQILAMQQRLEILEGIENVIGEDVSFIPYAKLGNKISKFGRNPDIDTAAEEDIWTVGGTRTWLSSAATLEAISTSANDDSAGSGAREITIEGLDSAWALATETLTMNGTSATSATTTSFFRINRAYVSQTGTYHGTNEGDITIRVSAAGATQTNIITGNGQTEQTHYSIPTGKSLLLTSFYCSVDGNKTFTPTLWQMPNVDDVTSAYTGAKRKIWGAVGVDSPYQHFYQAYPKIDGPADVWWSASVAANDTKVEAGFDGVLITT